MTSPRAPRDRDRPISGSLQITVARPVHLGAAFAP